MSWLILSTKIHSIDTVLWQKCRIWPVETAQCYSYEFVETEKLYSILTVIHSISTVLWQKHRFWPVETAQCYSYEFVETEKLYVKFP